MDVGVIRHKEELNYPNCLGLWNAGPRRIKHQVTDSVSVKLF